MTKDNKTALKALVLMVTIGLVSMAGVIHKSIQSKSIQITEQSITIENHEKQITVQNTELEKTKEFLKQKEEEILKYKNLFGELTDNTNLFQLPKTITAASIDTTFQLPMRFNSGETSTLDAQILKVQKFLPQIIEGALHVYTPTCRQEEINCTLLSSIPEKVDEGIAILGIQVSLSNETTNQTARVNVAKNFLALVDDKKLTPYASYLSNNILTDGALARHTRNEFIIDPLSTETITLLVKVPIDSNELILTYGANLSTQYNALKFTY